MGMMDADNKQELVQIQLGDDPPGLAKTGPDRGTHRGTRTSRSRATSNSAA